MTPSKTCKRCGKEVPRQHLQLYTLHVKEPTFYCLSSPEELAPFQKFYAEHSKLVPRPKEKP